MKQFEYEISKHPSNEFNHLVYFCTEEGACKIDHIPSDQTKILQDILNEKGANGWELAQTFFGKDGVMIIWKREI